MLADINCYLYWFMKKIVINMQSDLKLKGNENNFQETRMIARRRIQCLRGGRQNMQDMIIRIKLGLSSCSIFHLSRAYHVWKLERLNCRPTCISGSIPVLNANTRFAAAPIVVNTLLDFEPGMS